MVPYIVFNVSSRDIRHFDPDPGNHENIQNEKINSDQLIGFNFEKVQELTLEIETVSKMNEYYHEELVEKAQVIRKLQIDQPYSIIDLGQENLYKKTKEIVISESQKNIGKESPFGGKYGFSGTTMRLTVDSDPY